MHEDLSFARVTARSPGGGICVLSQWRDANPHGARRSVHAIRDLRGVTRRAERPEDRVRAEVVIDTVGPNGHCVRADRIAVTDDPYELAARFRAAGLDSPPVVTPARVSMARLAIRIGRALLA